MSNKTDNSMEMLKNLIVSFIRTIRPNSMGATLTLEREVTDFYKGRPNNRTEAYNRFYDEATGKWRVTKVTRYVNVTFQRDYKSAVEHRAGTGVEYVFDKASGKHAAEGCEGILMESDKVAGRYYLQVFENANTKYETTYYIDGELATDDETAFIKANLKPQNYGCKKQEEAGVDPNHIVREKTMLLTNILNITYGGKILIIRDRSGEKIEVA